MWRGSSLVLLSLALAVPDAMAQSGQAPFEIFAGRMEPEVIMPESGLGSSNVTVRVRCAPEDVPGTQITVTLEATHRPAFASAVLNPRTVSFGAQPDRCATPDFEYVGTSTLLVTLTRNAPAFEPFPLTVKGTLRRDIPGAQSRQYDPRTVNVTATPDFLAQVRVSPSTTFLKTPPAGRATFPVVVENLANGPSNASVELVTTPSGLNVTLPPAALLGTRIVASSGEPSTVLMIVVDAPPSDGYVNEVRSFVVDFSLRSVDPRGATSDGQTVTFSVQVQGFGSGQAGAPVGTVALAVLGLLAVLRRARP